MSMSDCPSCEGYGYEANPSTGHLIPCHEQCEAALTDSAQRATTFTAGLAQGVEYAVRQGFALMQRHFARRHTRTLHVMNNDPIDRNRNDEDEEGESTPAIFISAAPGKPTLEGYMGENPESPFISPCSDGVNLLKALQIPLPSDPMSRYEVEIAVVAYAMISSPEPLSPLSIHLLTLCLLGMRKARNFRQGRWNTCTLGCALPSEEIPLILCRRCAEPHRPLRTGENCLDVHQDVFQRIADTFGIFREEARVLFGSREEWDSPGRGRLHITAGGGPTLRPKRLYIKRLAHFIDTRELLPLVPSPLDELVEV